MPRQLLGHRLADALAGARDEGDFACQIKNRAGHNRIVPGMNEVRRKRHRAAAQPRRL